MPGMTRDDWCDWNDWDDWHDMDHSDGWHNSHGKVQVQVQLISLNIFTNARLQTLQVTGKCCCRINMKV